MAVFKTDFARHLPMEMVPVVRARRDMGGIREDELAVGVARHGIGVEHNRVGNRLHVPRGRKGPCYIVCRNPVGCDLDFACWLAEKRSGNENKRYCEGGVQTLGVFHVRIIPFLRGILFLHSARDPSRPWSNGPRRSSRHSLTSAPRRRQSPCSPASSREQGAPFPP